MKESINEHDMTKKMMQVMRGGYKPLLNEFVNAPNSDNTGYNEPEVDPEGEEQEEQEEPQGMAKPPREGRAPLLQLDSSYFEMDKDDYRFKSLSDKLKDLVPQAKITSVYIAEPEGLVINGSALNFNKNSGLYFTLALSEDSILVSSENVQGKIGTEVQDKLQKFLDLLRNDSAGTLEFQYNPQVDKENKPENE